MAEADTKLIAAGDFLNSLALLSRLPIPVDTNAATLRGAAAAWAYPLVGAVLGAIAMIAGWVVLWLGLSAPLVAAFILCTQIIITGAMHEDGLADTADGLWGGWDRAKRLEIMKDSHIGTYGVVALVLSLLVRWAAISALIAGGSGLMFLVATAALSRAPMVAVMSWLPNARQDGLSATVGRPQTRTVWIATGLAAVPGLLILGGAAVWAILWICVAAFSVALLARAKIGGQTGDILGATQQICEITVLAVLCSQITL